MNTGNANHGEEELDLEIDVKPTAVAPLAIKKCCTACNGTRDIADSFCWLCGTKLITDPINWCTRDRTHKADTPDHFCTTCGAQTHYGIEKDGYK